jgi:integrase/recombinase XerD
MKHYNGELLEKFTQLIKIKGKAPRTIDCYKNALKQFFCFCCKRSKDISKQDFINYLVFITEQGCSKSKHEQFINAWRMYLQEIHNKKLKYGNEYRPSKEKRLPKVLSESEILNGIKSCKNIKHKCILSVLFSTGMRRGELLNLKVKDIDSKNMIIRIKIGKGFKDRNVPLKKNLLALLREYYKEYKPTYFLFEGEKGKYSETSVANITKKYLSINPHAIRHSRGTNLINNGADITEVQKYFGHKNIKTTQIYTHISVDNLRKLHDPLEKAI